MLDTSLEHIGLIMVADSFGGPPANLPPGYHYAWYRPGFAAGWCALHHGAGQTDSRAQAEEIFTREFAPHSAELARRMLFTLAPDGSIAATAALWMGKHSGLPAVRLHWVTTAGAHRKKGIARAMLSALSARQQSLGLGTGAYLTTQTWSWPAVALYLQYGFVPYAGPAPEGWTVPEGEGFTANHRRGWAMVQQQLHSPIIARFLDGENPGAALGNQ